MKTIYLDTVSINKLYGQLNRKIKLSSLQKYNFAISSCQTDELGCIESPMLRSQLVEFSSYSHGNQRNNRTSSILPFSLR